jgi:hypothetical protein
MAKQRAPMTDGRQRVPRARGGKLTSCPCFRVSSCITAKGERGEAGGERGEAGVGRGE